MKKLNKKGFTLIELLAVITIMGILMIVAIPAIQRVIENSRRDTFANTASNYLNAVRNMWVGDSLNCRNGSETAAPSVLPSAATAGKTYYVLISSANQGTEKGATDAATGAVLKNTNAYKPYPFLLQQGGTSSWANAAVTGIVSIKIVGSGTNTKPEFRVALVDSSSRGIDTLQLEKDLVKKNVKTSGASSKIITSSLTDSTALTVKSGASDISATVRQYLCEEI